MIWILLTILVAGLLAWWQYERSLRRTRAMPGGHAPDIHLPHAETFELYHNDFSLCSKKSRMCLAELGIPYKSHHIDLIETGRYENIGRRYLGVHPGGILPLLVHRGNPVYESHEQIRYAAEHAPEGAPRLVPEDAKLVAEMERWVDAASLTGDDPIAGSSKSAGNAVPGLTVPMFAAMIEDISYAKIAEGLLFHRLRMRPLMFMAMKRTGLRGFAKSPAIKVVGRCRAHMHDHLDALEAWLAERGGPWILGEAFTLADVSWCVILDRLDEADWSHVFLGEQRPNLTAYWERLRARPSYETAMAKHVHPTVARGLERLRAAKAADPELRAALEGSPVGARPEAGRT